MARETVIQIAKSAHEVVRAFNNSLPEQHEILSFEDLTNEQRDNLIQSVILLYGNNRTYAGAVHDAWINKMIEKGWVYGEKHDEVLKTSPEMIDYKSLPKLSRAKDELFHKIVKMSDLYV